MDKKFNKKIIFIGLLIFIIIDVLTYVIGHTADFTIGFGAFKLCLIISILLLLWTFADIYKAWKQKTYSAPVAFFQIILTLIAIAGLLIVLIGVLHA